MIFCEFRGTSKLKILYYLNPTVAFCPSHNLSYRTWGSEFRYSTCQCGVYQLQLLHAIDVWYLFFLRHAFSAVHHRFSLTNPSSKLTTGIIIIDVPYQFRNTFACPHLL
jgi:hypothetical protein